MLCFYRSSFNSQGAVEVLWRMYGEASRGGEPSRLSTKGCFSVFALFVGWALPTRRDAPAGRLYAAATSNAAVSRSDAAKIAKTITARRGLLIVAWLQHHLRCDRGFPLLV